MKILQKLSIMVVMVGLGVVIMGQPVMAVSCPKGSVRGSANSLGECNIPDESATGGGVSENSLWDTVRNIINLIIGILGVVAVIMIVIGGVTYVTSSGEAANVTKAKNIIMYAIIGLVVALLAYAIVNFVLNNVFGSDAGPGEETGYSSLVIKV